MNKEIVVGLLWLGASHEVSIKQNEDGTFINSESEIRDWVRCLNNPWSDTSIYYEVIPDYQRPTTWIVTKTVIVYDDTEAKICAIGSSPQDAITACENAIKMLTEKYYTSNNG